MKITPVSLFVGASVVVVVVWALMIAKIISISADQLECLFTGLGFVGLVAAFVHERQQAEADDTEHAELIREMRGQAAAQNRATKFHAKVHRLDRCNARLSHLSNRAYTEPLEQERQTLREEIKRLEGELDRFSDTDPV